MKKFKDFKTQALKRLEESAVETAFRTIYAPQEIYGADFNDTAFDLSLDSTQKTLEAKLNNILETYSDVSTPKEVIMFVQKELMKLGLQLVQTTESESSISGTLTNWGGRYGQLDDAGTIGFDTGKQKRGYDIRLNINSVTDSNNRTTLKASLVRE